MRLQMEFTLYSSVAIPYFCGRNREKLAGFRVFAEVLNSKYVVYKSVQNGYRKRWMHFFRLPATLPAVSNGFGNY
jgi:hypothetical protein